MAWSLPTTQLCCSSGPFQDAAWGGDLTRVCCALLPDTCAAACRCQRECSGVSCYCCCCGVFERLQSSAAALRLEAIAPAAYVAQRVCALDQKAAAAATVTAGPFVYLCTTRQHPSQCPAKVNLQRTPWRMTGSQSECCQRSSTKSQCCVLYCSNPHMTLQLCILADTPCDALSTRTETTQP